jgi:hypothetical protein
MGLRARADEGRGLRTALTRAKLSAKSELAKAITYSLKRWTALTRFLNVSGVQTAPSLDWPDPAF